MSGSLYARIYEEVRRIPAGRVATYGQVAAGAGLPGHARLVGYALHSLREGSDVPWHRVVNARGGISLDENIGAGRLQRALLEAEGVVFDSRTRIDLRRVAFNLQPQETARLRCSLQADEPGRSPNPHDCV